MRQAWAAEFRDLLRFNNACGGARFLTVCSRPDRCIFDEQRYIDLSVYPCRQAKQGKPITQPISRQPLNCYDGHDMSYMQTDTYDRCIYRIISGYLGREGGSLRAAVQPQPQGVSSQRDENSMKRNETSDNFFISIFLRKKSYGSCIGRGEGSGCSIPAGPSRPAKLLRSSTTLSPNDLPTYNEIGPMVVSSIGRRGVLSIPCTSPLSFSTCSPSFISETSQACWACRVHMCWDRSCAEDPSCLMTAGDRYLPT